MYKTKNKDIPLMLDKKHSDIIEQFTTDNKITIPKLQHEISLLKQSKTKEATEQSTLINQQISKLQQKHIDYYLDNSKYIFGYFEEKKKISECKTPVKTLNQFFNIEKPTEEYKCNNYTIQYLKNIQEPTPSQNNFVNVFLCKECSVGEMIQIDYEGVLICNNSRCANQIVYLVEHEKTSYKEPPKEVCFYAYKRINHFREILAQFQAKESTQIPDEIIKNIKKQIKKERINIATITNKKAKEILKKFGYNKYYEHIPFIKDKLGIKPPIMTPDLEDKLCSLFMEIQRPYAKYCPDDRVNFLNYYYTIYKLCELLDETEFLPYFPMLKDREKQIEQDEIWKKICKELNWEFVPTI
jgi:vacuolar-type H+-ATPase subunit H